MTDVSAPLPTRTRPPFWTAFSTQMRVIGALIMRELHTRYGRENIGYLWLFLEPLILGSVIAVLHNSGGSHGGTSAAAFAMVGYTIFILFRGMVNRSEGAITANTPLLYHRMVTVLDICISRALLELAGTVAAFIILFSGCYALGFVELPPRPLLLLAGIMSVFWISIGVSMIVMGATYHNTILERLVHPFSYFQIPFSAAFFEMKSIPEPFRTYLLYSPLPHAFELVRYGTFPESTPEYIDWKYMVGVCMIMTLLGLIAMKSLKRRIHLM